MPLLRPLPYESAATIDDDAQLANSRACKLKCISTPLSFHDIPWDEKVIS